MNDHEINKLVHEISQCIAMKVRRDKDLFLVALGTYAHAVQCVGISNEAAHEALGSLLQHRGKCQ